MPSYRSSPRKPSRRRSRRRARLVVLIWVGLLLVGGAALVTARIPDWLPIDLPASAPEGLAPFYRPGVRYWADRIVAWADQTGLEANLVATLMQIESCGDPKAHSRAGAMGLFQVMPFHFSNDEDPFDPETNARRGLSYLQQSLEAAGGDIRLALAGYNGGVSLINRPEEEWPEETAQYVYWGEGIYQDAVLGETNSPRLNEWLQSGGRRLCIRAEWNQGGWLK